MSSRSWIVTPDDLKKGDLANPGWHPAEIVKYEDGEAGENAKNPGSATSTFYFKIIDGPNKGIECKRLFSEVAWGFGKNFFATMNYPKDEKGNYKLSSDLFGQSIGHKLQIYIKRGKSDKGNEFNDVADFRPMS
jgi:hypothetical protein